MRIASDREQVSAGRGAGEEQREQQRSQDRRNEKVGHGEEPPDAERDERPRQIIEGDRFGDAEIDPGEHGSGRESYDKAVDSGAYGQQPIRQSAAESDQKPEPDS